MKEGNEMSIKEMKELCEKVSNESSEESKDKSKNDMYLPMLLAELAFGNGGQSSNIAALEKEVAYLHGKVDALETFINCKNVIQK